MVFKGGEIGGVGRRCHIGLRAAVFAAAGSLIGAGPAAAAAGDLDTSFAANGKLVQNINTLGGYASVDRAQDVVVQADGEIVVGGSWHVFNTSTNTVLGSGFGVLRLTSAGASDGTGLGGGLFSRGSPPQNGANGIAVQPGGDILLAGTSGTMGSDFVAARLSAPNDGFDSSFGPPNGFAPLDFAGFDGAGVGTDGAQDLALQPNGSLVMAGYSDNEFAVGRMTSAGAVDNTFDANGRKRVDFTGNADFASSVALSGSKIIAAGYAGTSPKLKFAILSLLADGTPDPSFGFGTGTSVNGSAEIPHGANAMAVGADGKIIVAGPAGGDFGVGRLKTDGLYDPSFGANGQVAIDFGGTDVADAVALQPDGKVLVAGTDGDGFAVARLLKDGSLDSTFGSGGKMTVNLGGTDEAFGVAVQPNGKIVLAGTTGTDYAVTRLLADPPGPRARRCAGRPATLVGTLGNDRLTGTRAADVIVGLRGNDTFSGLRGNDAVCAGPGKDVLRGGSGKDRLFGEGGADTLYGGPGDDILGGGPGEDRLLGEGGRDRLRGGPGKDLQRQ